MQVKRRRYFENTQDIKKRKLSARFKKVFRYGAVGEATSHFPHALARPKTADMSDSLSLGSKPKP